MSEVALRAIRCLQERADGLRERAKTAAERHQVLLEEAARIGAAAVSLEDEIAELECAMSLLRQ